MLKLRFKNNKHGAVWLVEPKVTIGRQSNNDLVIEDPQVSERHIEILVKHENLTLINVSGANKVSVNDQPVENSVPLNINDVVTIGNTQLEVVDPKSEMQKPPPRPAAEQQTGWALKANSAALGNRVYSVKAITVVGRSNECDLTLAAAHLSRRHAQLTVQDGLLYAKDLGSANGTYLNGQRITEARVRRGDELRFDTLSFGVIGPTEDMDKTTVRPLSAISPVPPAIDHAGRSAVADQPSRTRVQAKNGKPKAGVAAPVQTQAPSGVVVATSGKSKVAWVLVALVLIGVAGAVAYQQGLL